MAFLPPEQLSDLIQSYIKDGIALKEQIADLCYHMKGGLEWNSAWGLSFEDREILIRVMNRRMKEQNPNGVEYM